MNEQSDERRPDRVAGQVAESEPKFRIRALHTESTITVYQAYRPGIGLPAARDGRFPPEWSRTRMTWIIKPR